MKGSRRVQVQQDISTWHEQDIVILRRQAERVPGKDPSQFVYLHTTVHRKYTEFRCIDRLDRLRRQYRVSGNKNFPALLGSPFGGVLAHL